MAVKNIIELKKFNINWYVVLITNQYFWLVFLVVYVNFILIKNEYIINKFNNSNQKNALNILGVSNKLVEAKVSTVIKQNKSVE